MTPCRTSWRRVFYTLCVLAVFTVAGADPPEEPSTESQDGRLLERFLSREVPAGFTVSGNEPLLIDDKSPIVYAPPATGFFGGFEATFFKMTRADGMRYDDSEEDSVNTDYSFTPRYFLGYGFTPDTGIRARFWGDYDDTSFPYDPGANPGDRVYGEASTFDLEAYRRFNLTGYEFEVSAGLQHVDYYEAIFDNNGNNPESAKAASGWGPVVGVQVRRDLRKGFQFYANARHSILATNASLIETGDPAYLDESNGGITEIGFGLEHERVIGDVVVTFRGGYEWQRWHNFSYGFEDSDSTDDIGGPADAGFHGFVVGVGITGRGPDTLVGKGAKGFSPVGYGDFGLGEEGPSGFFGEFEATFLKYSRADGLRIDDNVDETVAMGYEFTPRYSLGFRTPGGAGIRGRYWGDYDHFGLPQNPVGRADGDGMFVEASTVDVEFFDTFALRDYQLDLSVGLQSVNFFEGMFDDDNPGPELAKTVTGWGPVIGAELSREMGQSIRAFSRIRHSLLSIDAVTWDSPDLSYLDGSNGGVTEIAFGLEYQREIGNAEVTLHGGYEWQRWHNFSFAFEDSTATDDPSGPADAGFHGFVVGVGITGRDPSTDFYGAKSGPKAIAYPEADPVFFVGAEATFLKFGRADGMRFEDDEDDGVGPQYEFAPRYTLGYRSGSGLGLRARYWGDFREKHMPENPADAASQAFFLNAEANALDVEVFDTFSLGEVELDLSAGVQYIDYYEEIFDDIGPANPESAKSVTGWGPVIGAQLRRPFFGGTHVTAKARHSLLLVDASIVDDATHAFLNGANAGVTELGFGFEKDFVVGQSNVTVNGGYEWQQWHNVSYGFEDSNSVDQVSGPADAAFRGFTVGVQIER